VEVQNALIGLQQAQAQYQSAIKQRVLQQQTVDAERIKLAAGTPTPYNVILTERDLVTPNRTCWRRKRRTRKQVEMDRATGKTLTNNNISPDEAYRGTISRPPDRIPDVLPPQSPPQ
jgi:outer membrane protein